MENIEWGEFRISDLFEKIKVKSLKYKTSELPDKKRGEFTLPALTAGIQNQGLNNFVPRENATILKNVISISANGANTGATFYQKEEFTVLQDAYAIKWIDENTDLSDNQYIYLAASISKTIYGNYEWTNKAGWERIKSEKISLPTKNGEIDFEFMEDFIAELEAEKIKKLDEYLEENNLKDCVLTDKERQVLKDFENGKFKWREFSYEEFFNLNIIRNKLARKDLEIKGRIPVYSSESNNNGIIGYANIEPEFTISKDSPIYIVFGDHTRNFNIAADSFSVADNVKVLSVKKALSLNILLYIISSWKKCIPNKGYSRHWSSAKNILFNLPIRDSQPDYEKIEILISGIQKMVVKGVVEYVAEKK